MAALHVTYSDNMSGINIWMLHDLIWRASLRDIDRALFGDASSFLPVRGPSNSPNPTELRLRFVAACDLFPEQSDLISTSGGTMSGRHVHSHYPDPFINVL